MANDLTKAPKLVMIELINQDNASALTDALISFDVPTAATGENPVRNTELTVTAKPGSGYKGSVVITYNRLHLTTDILTPSGRQATFLLGNATLISDIVPEINTLLNINLTADDFIDGPLPTFTGGLNEEHSVQMVANADSLCYIGSMTFTLKAEEVDLSTVIYTTQLNGLTYQPPAA